jgi:hypothetical protein
LIFSLLLSACNSAGKNTPTSIPATPLPECTPAFLTWTETAKDGGFFFRLGNNNDPAHSLLGETVSYKILSADPDVLTGALTSSEVGQEFFYQMTDGTTSGPWNDVHFTQELYSTQSEVKISIEITTSYCSIIQEIVLTNLPVK